jgi:hypothetical protein
MVSEGRSPPIESPGGSLATSRPAFTHSAAFIAAERRPSSLDVVTLDDRLAADARKEGFVVIEVPTE